MTCEEIPEAHKWKNQALLRQQIIHDKNCFLTVYEPVSNEGVNMWVLSEAYNSNVLSCLKGHYIQVNKEIYPLSAFYCNDEIYFICDYQGKRGVSKFPDNLDEVWEFDNFKTITLDWVVDAIKTNYGFILSGRNSEMVMVDEDFKVQYSFILPVMTYSLLYK